MYQRHELLRAFGRHNGEMLNASAVARTLATTRLRVHHYLRILRSKGYLRLVPSLPEPCPPDMVRKPRLYLRARAWPHVVVQPQAPAACTRVPLQAQLAARITDYIVERETAGRRPARFYTMGRYRRRGVDLVVVRPSGRRLGFSFEPHPRNPQSRRAIAALHEALAQRWIDAAILVTCDGLPCLIRGRVLCLPAPVLLAMYSQWTREVADPSALLALLSWVGEHPQLVVGGFTPPDGPMGLDWAYQPVAEIAEQHDTWLEEASAWGPIVLPRPP